MRIAAALAGLALAATAPVPTPAQERRLAHGLVCPERLRDDAARIANTDRFMRLYARFAPASRSGERMALRDRLLAAKQCRDPHPLQHSYPET